MPFCLERSTFLGADFVSQRSSLVIKPLLLLFYLLLFNECYHLFKMKNSRHGFHALTTFPFLLFKTINLIFKRNGDFSIPSY